MERNQRIRVNLHSNILNLVKNKEYTYLMQMDTSKEYIISKFNMYIKNKFPITIQIKNHDGHEGHWIEDKMGIKHNPFNKPDMYGFEIKKKSYLITLGDFSASEYAFSFQNKRNHINLVNNWTDDLKINKDEFIHYFGNPNNKKNNRYSWSGKCIPHYNDWNECGQILLINDNYDIEIYYSFKYDKRNTIIPEFLKKNNILIAIWHSDKIKKCINNKFNDKGFCILNKTKGIYNSICFGKPFDFEYFIGSIKNKKIIFDSGMYSGNHRNYSHFRGYYNTFWEELIFEEYL